MLAIKKKKGIFFSKIEIKNIERGQYYLVGIDQIERQRKTNSVWSCPFCLLGVSPALMGAEGGLLQIPCLC